jgi:hypothetical protein
LGATQGLAATAVAEIFARARQLCQQLNQQSQLAVILSGQCVDHLHRAELTLACQLSKDIQNLGEAWNDPSVRFQGCLCSTRCWFHVGDFITARAFAEQALVLYDPEHAPNWAVDPQLVALGYLFRSLFYLGYLDQARSARVEALTQARQRTHAHTLAMLLRISLECDEHIQTDPAILLQQAQELAVLSAEHGFPY